MIVDLHVLGFKRATPIDDMPILHAVEYGVELSVRDKESVVAGLELVGLIKIQAEVLIDLHGRAPFLSYAAPAAHPVSRDYPDGRTTMVISKRIDGARQSG